MGGPMDVWEEDRHPWLIAEKQAIREAVLQRRLPYLGVCLGHQLLAGALGGQVGSAPEPEIGILDVELTAEGRADPLFVGVAPRFKALQWHSAEVAKPPAGAAVLARSPLCAVQAMRIGRHAYGLQYHCEILPRTVEDWSAIPAYAAALDASWGAGAMSKLEAAATAAMPHFNRDARQLYRNFMANAKRAGILSSAASTSGPSE
jgi:GMP synthase-like glutamine amidotransferase